MKKEKCSTRKSCGSQHLNGKNYPCPKKLEGMSMLLENPKNQGVFFTRNRKNQAVFTFYASESVSDCARVSSWNIALSELG